MSFTRRFIQRDIPADYQTIEDWAEVLGCGGPYGCLAVFCDSILSPFTDLTLMVNPAISSSKHKLPYVPYRDECRLIADCHNITWGKPTFMHPADRTIYDLMLHGN